MTFQDGLDIATRGTRWEDKVKSNDPNFIREEKERTISDYANLDPRRLWPSRQELREKVFLSTADMERLKAWHIPPYDKTDRELANYRKAKRKARRVVCIELRRANRGPSFGPAIQRLDQLLTSHAN
jgi:hypothetical protein